MLLTFTPVPSMCWSSHICATSWSTSRAASLRYFDSVTLLMATLCMPTTARMPIEKIRIAISASISMTPFWRCEAGDLRDPRSARAVQARFALDDVGRRRRRIARRYRGQADRPAGHRRLQSEHDRQVLLDRFRARGLHSVHDRLRRGADPLALQPLGE